MEGETYRELIKVFRGMDDESQQNVIRRVSNRDEEAAKYLRKVREMQKRGEKIDDLASSIIDKLE